MIESRISTGLYALILISIAGMGIFALWRSTPYGLGLVNDSAAYIGGAMNILNGDGYSRISGGGEIKPITHFPPLFSVLLAGVSLIGLDLLETAKVTILILFGVDILLVGITVYKITHSMVFACLGALLLAISDIHIGVYSYALSEPLFITLMLSSYLLLAEYFDRRRWYWLFLTGIFIGLAYLTRYAGISILITVLLTLFFLHVDWSRPRRIRLFKEIGILLLSSLPIISLWMIYNQSIAGSVSNRLIIWHPVSLEKIYEGMKNLLSWFAPDDLLAIQPFFGKVLSGISLIFLPTLLIVLGWLWFQYVWGSKAEPDQEINGTLGLFVALAFHILVYAAFIAISLSFFDATSPLDDRILSIIYVPGVILTSSALAWLWQLLSRRSNTMRWIVVLFSIVLVIFSLKDGIDTIVQLSQNGQGFAYQGWRDSETIQAIKKLPPIIIYSDKPNGIFFWTGRSSYIVPNPIDAVTTKPRPDYQAELEHMRELIHREEAVLILFDLQRSTDPEDKSHYNELIRGLRLQMDYGNAMIFAAEP